MARTRSRTATLGDRARYVGFLAPYVAFVAHIVRVGFELDQRRGAALACAVALGALPFWRAFCGRPVFAFYGLVLRRYRRKRGFAAFERVDDGSTASRCAKALRESAPMFTKELASFVNAVCVAGGNTNSSTSGDGREDARQPSEKMRDGGWSFIALHDATLDAPNRLAARCFPNTIRAMSALGGFNGKIWVLGPGAGGAESATSRVATGLADGYWRVHVVLARDAGLHGKSAGLKAGDETRALDLGSVHIVNDFHPRAFWNVSRDSGAVLLSFDVVRPENASCRAALVDARARLTQAFGAARSADDEASIVAYLWRTFSLTLLCNLS
jgi:hypothetical protein